MALILCWLLAAVPVAARNADAPLRVMTFNIRLPLAQDGPNAWEKRRDLAIETITKADPDILATQELFKLQGDHILERLPHFAWFGRGRRGGHDDEHMGIFYRHDRLRLIELGDFWLSDQPNVPGSLAGDHPFPRMVTWGIFESKADGRRFAMFNTHFAHRPEDAEIRLKAARAIADRIALLPRDMPVILAGDFNDVPGSPPHALLSSILTDSAVASPAVEGAEGTFHGFAGKPGKRIDWILVRGFDPTRVRTLSFNRNGRYPSDHYPVIAYLSWTRPEAK
jgi:endonuclease/exonuclease/phosphatase family metal-dependent hydrolase